MKTTSFGGEAMTADPMAAPSAVAVALMQPREATTIVRPANIQRERVMGRARLRDAGRRVQPPTWRYCCTNNIVAGRPTWSIVAQPENLISRITNNVILRTV